MGVSDNYTGFFINLPCGAAVAAFLLLIKIPSRTEDQSQRTVIDKIGRLDLYGFCLFSPAAVRKYPSRTASLLVGCYRVADRLTLSRSQNVSLLSNGAGPSTPGEAPLSSASSAAHLEPSAVSSYGNITRVTKP